MELEKEPITLEDRELKEVSTKETPIEKYLDEDMQDALMIQFDDDPFLQKPSDPPN